MPDHSYFSNLIWQIADLLRGPYRPPQYERVMLPMTVLRRFDCVLAPTKAKVLAEFEKAQGRQARRRRPRHPSEQCRRPALPQSLGARLREAEG
jgi:type I restriction-modification system DNA methylase subunit